MFNYINATDIYIECGEHFSYESYKPIINNKLRLLFEMGTQVISASHEANYFIYKVESSSHIYEMNQGERMVKISNKLTGELVEETKEKIFFFAMLNCRIHFPVVIKDKRNLLGLETVIDDMRIYENKVIFLYGPNNDGIDCLFDNLDIIYPDKFIINLDSSQLLSQKDIIDYQTDQMNQEIVLYIKDFFQNDLIIRRKLIHFIKRIKSKKSIKATIIIHSDNITGIDGYDILVPHPLKSQKLDFVKGLIEEKNMQQSLDKTIEESNELIDCLNNICPTEIERMFEQYLLMNSTVSWESLIQFTKDSVANLPKSDLLPSRKIQWKDIGGYESVKKLLVKRFEKPLKSADRNFFKGLVLHGPPGCSKTTFARALATECGVPIFIVTCSSIMKSYLGQSEAALRQIFQQAEACSPSIIFIDELELIFQKRNASSSSSVVERLLSELLTFLDGIETSPNNRVIVVAATNNIDRVDEALLRGGRLSTHILIGLPDQESREEILKIAFSKSGLAVTEEVIERIPELGKLFENKSGIFIIDTIERMNHSKSKDETLSWDALNTLLMKLINQ